MCFDEKLVLVKENKTWEEALDHCRSLGAVDTNDPNSPYRNHRYDLATLITTDDHTYARERAQQATTDEVWTGLYNLAGEWLWVGGEQMQYENIPSCPTNGFCGVLEKSVHLSQRIFPHLVHAPVLLAQAFLKNTSPRINMRSWCNGELRNSSSTKPGSGEKELIIKSRSLELLNDMLVKVSYTSTVYHINTGDLVTFQFENHEAVFAIAIKQPHVPVLYDMGTDISSQVTIATKTFLRYEQLKVLLDSIRKFYSNIKVIVADDSFEPEHITGENIQHYIMPPAQGWFAGRNLAVSQVTTKYFLWVDDDFLFTEKTKIEKLVEVMEAVPELDVVGGSVKKNQFYFSLIYEEGEETEGGCLYRKSNKKLHSVPGYPQCFLASGVVNFFLARTDAVQRVGFDPKLQRLAHSEFFMDGLGYLLVATCGDVSIDHQHVARSARYRKFRSPRKDDSEFKLQLHFFKNHLKCIKYG
ncbi:beta-1,4 N-acetylgalactosaminyltransferase 2-like [Pelmatolapia mariae]|uniref:beta-1,4 N-acetylgalactosaminyltransferase 2-like n=1 Tax=Pelmatolapia mariae TaxID=158779 RepID=UPI002FE61C08